MACIQNPSSTDNDASNIEELIDALRDIQSVDFDKLRATLLQSQSEGASRCRCGEYEEMKVRCDKIESERNYYKSECEKLSTFKASIENEFSRVNDELRKKEGAFFEQTGKISGLQEQVHSLETYLKDVQDQLHNYQYQQQSKEEKRQIQKEANMITETEQQTPVESKMPDRNGHARLGKIYTDLYDNEWPNAYDLLTSKFHIDDKTAIELLRRILLECYKHAFEMCEKQLMKAEHVLTGGSKRVDLDCRRLLKEARTHVDIKQADDLHKKFLETYLMKAIPKLYLTEPVIKTFATECFQLCWLMAVQDPPAAFAEDPAQCDQFDTNIYSYFTISGDKIDTVVLPALLFHENGPLLAKGIAQCYPRTRALSASTAEKIPAKVIESSETTQQHPYLKNATETTYGSDTTQYGHQVQADVALLSNSHLHPMRTQTDGGNYGAFSTMSNAPAEGYAMEPTQYFQIQWRRDWERFQCFCQYYRMYDEPYLRNTFAPDYDRYCYYLNYGFPQIFGFDPTCLHR